MCHRQNLMMWLELNLAVQSWVSSMKSSGLSTQPCGHSRCIPVANVSHVFDDAAAFPNGAFSQVK